MYRTRSHKHYAQVCALCVFGISSILIGYMLSQAKWSSTVFESCNSADITDDTTLAIVSAFIMTFDLITYGTNVVLLFYVWCMRSTHTIKATNVAKAEAERQVLQYVC
jgi:hypothetical protein